MINTTEYMRFRWSHDHILHRRLVRIINALMCFVPFGIKYRVGLFLRRNRPPYNLIRPGALVAQIGAPLDTLLAGRSRAAYFCLLAGKNGRVIIVEPDPGSLQAFAAMAQKQVTAHIILAACAAWSEKRRLEIYINPSHPASSFTGGTKHLSRKDLREFRRARIPADTLDNISAANNISQLDLVSVTTNGSEMEIIKGMVRLISHGVSYIALARTGNYIELMKSIGYGLYAHDDRGFTFRQVRRLSVDDLRKVLWR